MNKRRFRLWALLTYGVLTGLTVVLVGWMWRAVRQERLNQALMTAIHQKSVVTVQQLLAEGADPNASYKPGKKSMWQMILTSMSRKPAPLTSNLNAVQYCLHEGSFWPPRETPDWETRYRIVRLLIEAGASANTVISIRAESSSLLSSAILDLENGTFKQDIVRVLLKHGADVDGRKEGGRRTEDSPLILVFGQGDYYRKADDDVVEILLDAGANVRLTNSQGQTALSVAADRGSFQALKLLLKAGSEVDSTDDERRTAFMVAMDADYEDKSMLLLGHGANIDAQDIDGNTELMRVSTYQYPTMVRFLLSHHASNYIKNHKGQTAFALANGPILTLGRDPAPAEVETANQNKKKVILLLKRAGSAQ